MIFAHAMVGFAVWVGELFLFAGVIDHEGRSDNFDGVERTSPSSAP